MNTGDTLLIFHLSLYIGLPTGWALRNGPPLVQQKVRFSKFTTLYGISSHQTNLFQSKLNSKMLTLVKVYSQKAKKSTKINLGEEVYTQK